MWCTWLGAVALLPGAPRPVTPRARPLIAQDWPVDDWESNAALFEPLSPNAVFSTLRRPPPDPATSPVAQSSEPVTFEAQMRRFDFLGSTDAEVEECAAAIFGSMRQEAEELLDSPLTAALATRCVLSHETLSVALASIIGTKVKYSDMPGAFAVTAAGGARVDLTAHEDAVVTTFVEALSQPETLRAVVADLAKAFIIDPAADGMLQPALFFKGFHALLTYRVAHSLWRSGKKASRGAALMLQSRASELFAVDIHPAATIGPGVMLDHGTAIVIGATAVLGSDLYILHQVTLGATGKPMGGAKRHPTVGDRVVLGAGCTILGDVTVGSDATVGAAAVVTRDVPEMGTVVGVNKLVSKPEPTRDAEGKASEQPEPFTWYYDI